MNRSRRRAWWNAIPVAVALAASDLGAQVTTPPELGPPPAILLPTVDTARLGNGLTVLVARNAEVPIVSARLVIDGGARVEGVAPGVVAFTAGMLDEGAGARDAFAFAEATAFLGARLSSGADWEMVGLTLSGPKRTFSEAMALLADAALRPAFAASDVARQRDLRLAELTQERDEPDAVADRVFARNVFPAWHPYHVALGGDSANVARIDSALVRRTWDGLADPRRATLVLTGDITLAEARAMADRHFGAWTPPAAPLGKLAAGSLGAAPRPATRIILVDKPGAAQSVLRIGAPGVPRNTPDYAALALMNTILGGSFSARVNDILREQRGYTYGARTGFGWSPVPDAFEARTSVRTDVTDSSVAILFREFARLRDEPVPTTELERARNYLVLGSAGDFETAGQLGTAIVEALLFGRSLTAISEELEAITRLTAEDVQRAARRHLDPAALTVVIVGDVAAIRPGLERLGLGPITVQAY
ncbi:MAG TPA: pitrilysin family protein [Gemmatimonadales bacterium]|nr:pitrilysin family protein [Gemmatimonadales bacterium]